MKGSSIRKCENCLKMRPQPYATCAQQKLRFCNECYSGWQAQRVDQELDERRRESRRPDIIDTIGHVTEDLVDRIINSERKAWPDALS